MAIRNPTSATKRRPPRKPKAPEEPAQEAASPAPADENQTQGASVNIGREEIKAVDTDLMRSDRAISLTDRMFVLNPDSERIQHSTQELQGRDYEFRYVQMGGTEWLLLNALLVMLQSQNIRGTVYSFSRDEQDDPHNPAAQHAKQVWQYFGPSLPTVFGNFAAEIRSSLRQLIELMGWQVNGQAADRVMAGLRSLSEVSIKIRDNAMDAEVSAHLLAYARVGGELSVFVNPYLVRTVGQRDLGAFRIISMDHLRSFRSDSAVLLYRRLIGWMDEGREQMVSQDKLEEYVWGDALAMSDNAESRKSRKKAIMRGLAELQAVGWGVVEIARRGQKSMYRIRRPVFDRDAKEAATERQLSLLLPDKPVLSANRLDPKKP